MTDLYPQSNSLYFVMFSDVHIIYF